MQTNSSTQEPSTAPQLSVLPVELTKYGITNDNGII